MLLSFLDAVCELDRVDLSLMDLSSPEALCFFSNVYHTMLVHARLLLRPPSKLDWSLYFSSISYQVGDDVFSLAELEQCVLRGKLCRPNLFTQYDALAVPITDAHFAYTLTHVDRRLDLLLTTGSVSNPPFVYLLCPSTLEARLDRASLETLIHSASVDMAYRTVTLPKVVGIYRSDFGDDSITILKNCLQHLDRSESDSMGLGADLEALLAAWAEKTKENPNSSTHRIQTKYLIYTYESHARLILVQ